MQKMRQSRDGPRRMLVSREEGREMSGLSLRSFEFWIASGAIKTRKIGRRRMVVLRSLEKFLAEDHEPVSTKRRAAPAQVVAQLQGRSREPQAAGEA